MLAGQPIGVALARIADRIVLEGHARDTHHFHARDFRDHIQSCLPTEPIQIDPIDAATLRLGLGWKVRNRDGGAEIEGMEACTAFLNALVKNVEDDVCAELRAFDRLGMVTLAIENHEATMLDRTTWHRTAAAMLSLHGDAAAKPIIAERTARNNSVLLASRALAEIANCECPLNEGLAPGKLDLSRMMAKVMLSVMLGGWSDAIYWDAIAPTIRVTPLGDVHVDSTFFEQIMQPFGRMISDDAVEDAIDQYASNYKDPEIGRSVQAEFGAWNSLPLGGKSMVLPSMSIVSLWMPSKITASGSIRRLT